MAKHAHAGSTGLGGGLSFLLALVLAAILAGCGGSSGGDTTDGSGSEAGTDPISLPARIGGLDELMKVVGSKGPAKVVKEQAENQEEVTEATMAAYSKAFDGAAAAYRSYADSELLHMPYVIAVRAEAPGMTFGPVASAAALDLAKPPREVRTVGGSECLIVWSPPVLKGHAPEPSAELTTNCQRSGSGVTVFVGASAYGGPDGLKALAGFTDAAWDAVVGD